MAKGFLSRAAAAIRRDLGNEFAYAVDDIRHKVVEQPMFGRSTTPSAFDTPPSPEAAAFYRWLGDQKGADDQEKGDPMGRSSPEAEKEPMEGRPSEVDDNLELKAAFERHQKAGPNGLIEMENYYRDQWQEFEGWLEGKDDGWGRDDIAEESRALEQAREGAEHEID